MDVFSSMENIGLDAIPELENLEEDDGSIFRSIDPVTLTIQAASHDLPVESKQTSNNVACLNDEEDADIDLEEVADLAHIGQL